MSAWTLGQAWPQTSPSNASSATITGPAPSVIGRRIILWVFWTNAFTVSTVTDNAVVPNTYSLIGTSTEGSNHNTALYTAVINSIPASGNMTITVTMSGVANSICLAAAEYNGQNASIVFDLISLIQDGGPFFPASDLFTTAYTDTLIIAAYHSAANSTVTIGAGFNSRGINSIGQGAADSLGTVVPTTPLNLVPFSATNTAPSTAYVLCALVANDSTLVGKNAPAATAPVVRQYARGLFPLNGVDASWVGAPVFTQANMSGPSGRFSWKNCNPSIGVYNWNEIDSMINLCQLNNKYYALGVFTNPGPASGISKQPSWLGSTPMGACSTYTYWNASNTVPTVGYAPWDPIFQFYYKQFVQAFGARYDGSPLLAYIALDSGVGDGESYITRGTNGVGPLNALGGVQIWINAMVNGYVPFYVAAFPKTQLIFVTGAPVPGDVTSMPSLLATCTSRYGSHFGFKSDGLTSGGTPADYFQQYTVSHPLGFQPSPTGNIGVQQMQRLLANGYTLAGDVTKLGGQFFELYQSQYTDANSQELFSLYNQLLFGNNPPVIPQPWFVLSTAYQMLTPYSSLGFLG
jgi:hypothetical protein